MNKTLSNYLPGIILLIVALVVGLVVHRDYGVSWDELMQRRMGQATYDYVFAGNNDLFKYEFKYYGTGFELPLMILERKLGITGNEAVIHMRHLVTHLFFLLGALAAYALVFRLFNNRFLACVGFIMLLTEPRLYAHSFFNSKDIPFLSAVMIALFVCQLAFERNRSLYYALLGVAIGYATSIRVMGLMLAAFVLAMLAIDFVFGNRTKKEAVRKVLHLCSFSAAFCLSVYVFWPFLWSAPVTNLVDSFNFMSVFEPAGGNVFFKGRVVPVRDILPEYIVTWFSITTPVLWLCAGAAGLVWIVIDTCRRPLQYLGHSRERNFVLYVLCFVAPALAIIALRSVIYDDWRHLYFIYPPFMLMSVYFFYKLMTLRYRWIIQGAIGLQVLIVGWFMVRSHPHQQVYFNGLVSHQPGYLRRHYDMDYWGASFKQGLEYIVKARPEGRLRISSEFISGSCPLSLNIRILPPMHRERIEVVSARYADYFITNFRGHPGDYAYPLVYHICVEGDTILGVYKAPAEYLDTMLH